jgi:hypothetical protein
MGQITKTIRITGSSPDSFEDAVTTVLARTAETVSGIEGFEVVRQAGSVDEAGVVTRFEVTVDITFGVRESVHG